MKLKKNILISHGLGDYIGSDSYLTVEELNAIETVYWCSANRLYLQDALRVQEIFPNLKNEVILYDDWGRPDDQFVHRSKFFRIESKQDLNGLLSLGLDQNWITNELLDTSLPAMVQEILKGNRKFRGSHITPLHYTLPNIALPERYVLIHPWSESQRGTFRDFDNADWEGVLGCLERNNLTGIVVNKSPDYPPLHPNLIDLTNQTTAQEVFALIKKATWIMACASFIHVFAPKVIPWERIFIKSKYPWLATRTPTFLFYHGPVDPKYKLFESLNFLKDKDL
jgi:hypothetical protein